MKRILTVLAGVSLLASFFAAAPAPVSAVAPGGWWATPDHVVATRDLNRGPVGTCTNPDFTSIEAAVEDLDETNIELPDSWTIGVCKGTHILTGSINLYYDEFTFVGQGASNTVIDGSKIAYYTDGSDDGIIEYSANDITVANITFKGGAGTDGGAIYTDLDFYCSSSSFIGNSATNDGGAVYVVGDALLERCTFRNNTADVGGGAVYGEGSVIDYGGNYTLNTADWGGAVAQGASVGPDNTSGFYSSTFTKNSAVDGNGGAIYADDGDTIVVASRFTGNMSTDNGGAIAKQGCSELSELGSVTPYGLAYLVLDKCTLDISDSNFLSNTAAGDGGAVASLDLTTGVSITGSTFQLNRADNGAAVASLGLLDAGQNLFVRNRASGVGIVTYFADRVATYCDYGFDFTDDNGGSPTIEDLDPIYLAAVIDAADRIDLSANRFSRNIGASTVNYGTDFGPVPSWVSITELQLNFYCTGPA